MNKYQQGDVLFVNVEENKWNINEDKKSDKNGIKGKLYKMILKSTKSKYYGTHAMKFMKECVKGSNKESLTVAFGEATGHSHKFHMENHDPKITIMSFGRINTSVGQIPEFVNITGGPATITHEEHAPLTIPEGHYKVSIVREYDHLAGRARFVID